MQKIHAWIYNPDHAIFKGSSKKAALYELHCEKPEECELYTKCNSCLLQDGMGSCKFGKKHKSEGPTKRARSYYTWTSKARENNEEYFGKLSANSYGGIFKAQNHYYLPYRYMVGAESERFPIGSAWIHENEMTSDLLEKICEARPRYLFDYRTIAEYQDKSIPRFLHDLKTSYPKLFQLLPEKHQKRVEDISFIGRKADINTCAPGTYKLGTNHWEWDGEKLIGNSMLFQPVKGKIRIEIEPDERQPAEITNDNQVTPETVFLD